MAYLQIQYYEIVIVRSRCYVFVHDKVFFKSMEMLLLLLLLLLFGRSVGIFSKSFRHCNPACPLGCQQSIWNKKKIIDMI